MPHVFCCATHFGLPSLPVLFCCTTLFFLPSLPLSTLPTCELRSTVSIREYISGFPHSEHRSCLSTREHRSGISIQRAPLLSIHSRALLGAIHPLWVSFSELRSCFSLASIAPGSPPALGLHTFISLASIVSGLSTRSGSTHFYVYSWNIIVLSVSINSQRFKLFIAYIYNG